jgi:hypothetical protein
MSMGLNISRLQKNQLKMDIDQLKERKICSNVILYCLCRASPSMKDMLIDRLALTSYDSMGDFLPDSIHEIMKVNPKAEVIYRE